VRAVVVLNLVTLGKQKKIRITRAEATFQRACVCGCPIIPIRGCHKVIIFLARSANLPEGLYILLALISYFFFLIFYYDYEQSYLSIYWTDFHDLFTKWKVFT